MIRYGSNLGLWVKCLNAKYIIKLINYMCLYNFWCTISIFFKDSAEKTNNTLCSNQNCTEKILLNLLKNHIEQWQNQFSFILKSFYQGKYRNEIEQMDVFHFIDFGKLRYVHHTIDTFLGF